MPDLEPAGIVPPWMSKDWMELRSKLHQVAAAAHTATRATTTEDLAKCLGVASAALIDADFIRRRIERATDHTNGSQA